MAIIQSLKSFSSFYDAIYENRKEQFTRGAWEAIYDYLEDLSYSIGEPIEFNCVAICCNYTEYESIKDFINASSGSFEFSRDDLTIEEQIGEIEDYLSDHTTTVCVEPDCILFAAF